MKYLNRSISILLILTGTLTLTIGQTTLPGYLITLEGDTVSGAILPVRGDYGPTHIDYFIVDPGKSERSLPAKDVAKYTLLATGDDRRQVRENYYAKRLPHNSIRVFVEPRQDGKAQLYLLPDPEAVPDPQAPNKIVFDRDSANASKEMANYFSTPETEFLFRLSPDNFEIALKQMLKDCPKLTEKLGKKNFRFKDLENIITFYNESCE